VAVRATAPRSGRSPVRFAQHDHWILAEQARRASTKLMLIFSCTSLCVMPSMVILDGIFDGSSSH